MKEPKPSNLLVFIVFFFKPQHLLSVAATFFSK